MKPSAKNSFVTAVDTWLGALLLIAPIACVATIIAGIVNGSSSGVLIGILSTLLLVALAWAVVWPIRYTIDADMLRIRSGNFIRRDIALSTITKVSPSNNPLSSPAFSLNRLRIDYQGGWVLISPKRREAFLDQLEKATGLKRDGESLGA